MLLPIGLTNEDEARMCNLWMGDVQPYMTRDFVMTAFHLAGEHVLDVKIMKHKNTNSPMRHAFVEFPTIEAAKQAQWRLNGKPIPRAKDEQNFQLTHRRHREFSIEFSLFVGDLDPTVDDLLLYTVFHQKFPRVVKTAKVVLDDAGKSRGFGFVRFTEEDVMHQAEREMQGHKIGDRNITTHEAKTKNTTDLWFGKKAKDMTMGEKHATSFQNFPQFPQQMSHYDYYQEMQMQGVGGQMGQYPMYWDPKNDPQMQQVPEVYPGQEVAVEEEDYQLEDPELEVDVDKMNAEFMAQSEEWWDALESSRWWPLDTVYATISSSKSDAKAEKLGVAVKKEETA